MPSFDGFLFGMGLLWLESVILASAPTLLCSREASTCFVAQEVVEESDKHSLFHGKRFSGINKGSHQHLWLHFYFQNNSVSVLLLRH